MIDKLGVTEFDDNSQFVRDLRIDQVIERRCPVNRELECYFLPKKTTHRFPRDVVVRLTWLFSYRCFGDNYMRKLMFGVLLTVFLALSSGALGQRQGTGMLHLRPADCPAILVESKHASTDMLESAVLKNVGSKPITGYRIGWIAIYPTGKDKVGLGVSVDLPLGIASGTTVEVPAQGVSMDYAKEGAIAVVFFVTDIRTSKENGATESIVWKPALEELEQQALMMTKSVMSSSR